MAFVLALDAGLLYAQVRPVADRGGLYAGRGGWANTAGVFCGGWLMDALARRGHADAPPAVIGAACMAAPAVAFTQVDLAVAVGGLLLPAMFFASFPCPRRRRDADPAAQPQLRAQVSALFLLISNLIGLGLGTTAVALLTDRWFRDPAAVGQSLSAMIGAAAVACVVLLAMGCGSYRRSLAAEAPGAAEASDGAALLTARRPRPRSGYGCGAGARQLSRFGRRHRRAAA